VKICFFNLFFHYDAIDAKLTKISHNKKKKDSFILYRKKNDVILKSLINID